MGQLIAIEHLTLDGVMQAPGHADEDPRDGFAYGGWAARRANDPAMQQTMGEHMSSAWSLLAGRTTYERFVDSAAMDTHNKSDVVARFFGVAKPILDGDVILKTCTEISVKA